MATTQLEVLALWTRARRETDAATRQTFLAQAEQLTAAESDPREQQFAQRVLTHFQRWLAHRTAEPLDSHHTDDHRYRLAPARW
jgi:hypothetical protein